MDHLAIMNPRWKLIEKILTGEKTIESRWYANKIAPWNRIIAGDQVYFKDAGKEVTAKATVQEVLQFELSTIESTKELLHKYQKGLCFSDESLTDTTWLNGKRYAILLFLTQPETIKPFAINKKGYGSAAAWICVDSINKLKL